MVKLIKFWFLLCLVQLSVSFEKDPLNSIIDEDIFGTETRTKRQIELPIFGCCRRSYNTEAMMGALTGANVDCLVKVKNMMETSAKQMTVANPNPFNSNSPWRITKACMATCMGQKFNLVSYEI